MTVHSTDKTIFTQRESEARSYCRGFDTVFTSAQGSELTDAEGNTYIDFLAGCSSLNYGHNDPDMKEALINHLLENKMGHALDLHTDSKGEFLRTFEEHILAPRGMDHKLMFVGPTGANAVEAAMKIARKATGRTNIIAFTNGFHGVTMGALSATGNGYHRGGAGMDTQGVTRMPYDAYAEGVDSVALLDQMLSDASGGIDAPAAIMLETVQGEGGLNAASPEFIQGVEKVARKHGALFIIDDIQAGCGRTGTFFSFEGMGVMPDIVTQAKSISGFGLPMALVLVRPDYDVFGPAEHNGTFRGNTHAFVTATVAIKKFWADDAFQRELAVKSDVLREGLAAVADLVPGAFLKGRGLMQGVDVGTGELASAICGRCFEKGLVIETSGNEDQVVKVLAPLTTPMDQFRKGLQILRDATTEVMAGRTRIAAE
ncbi:MAG: diaminobutyrate--2-oxoglutarate transaminase [Rhodobacteraceae bacterium]|uniref:diaminobutyrate--2-oxoglutarate transaminase n=1 Tax=Thioclava sp. L04-15 TaxID=1915318 RepID=UPI0009985506|nr:diaminobutyrate--2-oxoglutarate transaminase [Thioclava sp. L04-15]OOY29204.1 diaminobutyrate--2-oxoglutarate transaminase [Thioclava sp. L04-15]TNE88340.1 MAG: diaminobutyrate--2-oxoglutarate transaminase [Paracoccaceae bacterium]TNF11963.1 MAG: diaminobutyrate--2-oxoglutarate transaminase [Paracoccaceae bacterium]